MLILSTLPPAQPVADILPPILMTVGIVMLGWLLVATIRGKISRRQTQQPTPRERIDAIKTGGGRHVDPSEEHVAGMLSVAQRLASQLDNKAARLEQLIDLADERIALISAELAETSEFEGLPHQETTSHEFVGQPRQPAGHADRSHQTNRQNGTSAHPDQSSDPLARAVYELADGGHSPVEIARRLDEHTGKIELILALRQ